MNVSMNNEEIPTNNEYKIKEICDSCIQSSRPYGRAGVLIK